MKVCVVVPSRRAPVALEVSRDDTVASVKARLHELVGIPPRRQRLEFHRSALPDDDDTTLADHGVVDSAARIPLVQTKMHVFVRVDRTIELSGIESSDTVESFRLRLQERVGIRPAQQRLTFGGAQLEDGHTLGDYSVQNESTIHFLDRFGPRKRTKVVELDMDVSDTVRRIKERVEEAEGVPVECLQSVCFHGMDLDDSRTLAHYDGRLNKVTWVEIERGRHETGGRIKKRKTKGEEEPVVTQEIPMERRRRLWVSLVGPELESIHPSSCDWDPQR